MEESLLQAIREQPDDIGLRLIFSDWLEEHGDPRGELLRLTTQLTGSDDCIHRNDLEARLRALLATGVEPIGPRWTNSLGMEFVWVPPGTFVMGSPPHEKARRDDEAPHRVTLSRGFFIGVHPVTQEQWEAVTGNNPSCFRGPDFPVECVSFEDCEEFCRLLAKKDSVSAGFPSPYRLPTEAEWEFACRGATTTPYSFGDTVSTHQANYHGNYVGTSEPAGKYRQETTPVGSFPANAWGLRDMHGNVFEWCADWYAPYAFGQASDPFKQQGGNVRVLRGGSWHSLVGRCRSASRAWGAPGYRGSDVGCRICFRTDYHFTI